MDRLLVSLPDQREVEVGVSGPPGGQLLLWHHGTPGGAYQMKFLADAVHTRGWRLVTMARPGYGASTRLAGRIVADVVPDVAAVLDHLGADVALIGGASGGGPHSIACAALMPERVRAALAVCSLAPYEAEGLDFLAGMGQDNLDELSLAVQGEQALRPYIDEQLPGMAEATADQLIEGMSSLLPEVDRACLTGDVGADFAVAMNGVGRAGPDGWIDDDLAFLQPWGFGLEQVRAPVSLWQGELDLMVPFSHGQWLASHIPAVHAHLESGQGHLSITVGALERMLDELEAVAAV